MKKNIITTAATVITSAVMIFTAAPITSFAAGNITIDQAKKIALENSGLKADQVTFVKESKEIDDGRTQYEVEFYVGTTEYDYEIDAATGAIISFDQDMETNIVATAPKATTATTAATTVATTGITKDQALQVALDHAGYKKSDVLFPTVKKDFDDGMEIWEVKFYVGLYEYQYDISVANGQIIDFDLDD